MPNFPGPSDRDRDAMALTALPRDVPARVVEVRADAADERLALRLMELGFIEGEPLTVVAFGHPGRDPIGVRLGGRGGAGAFALRRKEAALVWVRPEAATPGAPG